MYLVDLENNERSCEYSVIQYVAKSIATCKKNPYIINQNHIFSKNYCEVISGQMLINFIPKHSELSIFGLFICSLCLYEWFLFVHNLNRIVQFQDLFLVEIYRKIKVHFYLLCLNHGASNKTFLKVQLKTGMPLLLENV